MSIPTVYALGISAPYWETNPLKMFHGETKTVELTIHNIEEKDIIVKASMIQGEEIAEIQEEYPVPAKTSIKIPITITIPQKTPYTQYTIKLSFRQVKSEKEGMVQLASGIDTSFPVIVETPPQVMEEPKTEKNFTISIILVIILVIILMSYLFLKKKNE